MSLAQGKVTVGQKFYTWSDTKGNIENSFTKDELLTNIMIYWVTQTINTSIRTYFEDAEASHTPEVPKPRPRVEVPTGVVNFPAEAPLPCPVNGPSAW